MAPKKQKVVTSPKRVAASPKRSPKQGATPKRAASPKPSPKRAASPKRATASTSPRPEAATPPLSETLKAAAKKALGGGLAGALAMVVQVAALMWMRTTINFQHAEGMSTLDAMSTLYAQGGIARFYQGWSAALLQAPLSRFGDTASNAGVLALLAGVAWMPPAMKTFFASSAAGLFRITITPLDALKTTLQVRGAAGLTVLTERIATDGILTLYSGALATSIATFMGHYPWFLTYNYLQAVWPRPEGNLMKNMRSAVIGFISSFASDVISNSVRVVKTAKQTSCEGDGSILRPLGVLLAPCQTVPIACPVPIACRSRRARPIVPHPRRLTPLTYWETVESIMAADGISGLFLRGLSTKLISNGVQAMLFTIWCARRCTRILACPCLHVGAHCTPRPVRAPGCIAALRVSRRKGARTAHPYAHAHAHAHAHARPSQAAHWKRMRHANTRREGLPCVHLRTFRVRTRRTLEGLPCAHL